MSKYDIAVAAKLVKLVKLVCLTMCVCTKHLCQAVTAGGPYLQEGPTYSECYQEFQDNTNHASEASVGL